MDSTATVLNHVYIIHMNVVLTIFLLHSSYAVAPVEEPKALRVAHCLSVCPSVLCLSLPREQKIVESANLVDGGSHSKTRPVGQSSRSLNSGKV